ncbi:MAG: hypothetical protein JWQ71_1768 [Pedosphaera sp.]|nr:hypothetical protein [Pedosphaera sp.]
MQFQAGHKHLSPGFFLLPSVPMRNYFLWVLLAGFASSAFAAERRFDFSESPENQSPTNCHSMMSGTGKPANWKVIMADVPLALPALTPNAPSTGKKAVVAQLAEEMTDEHFPMLVLGDDTYSDFTFSTRFKIVSGIFEQMAGIAFRVQDEKNYYVLRASALGNNVRFYKVINGERGSIIGPDMPIAKDTWHELSVECKGNQIHCLFDGKEIMPMLTDNSLGAGKIAFWTKSDSVSYFTDTRITYTPRERFLQTLVRESMRKNPRLVGVQIATLEKSEPRLAASSNEKEIGQPGEKNDIEVINKGVMTYRKEKDLVYVTLPLCDRNGDPAAAVRLAMKSFAGQTQENALVRAMPIVKQMQTRVPAVNDLRE